MKNKKRFLIASSLLSVAAATALTLLTTQGALAQKNTTPAPPTPRSRSATSRPIAARLRAYGIIGKTQEAYFKMINDQGGIGGRKINFISYDDGYSPPKTDGAGPQADRERRGIPGVQRAGHRRPRTPCRNIIRTKKISQLFLATSAASRTMPKGFPWTMGFQRSYRFEALIFAKYILKTSPRTPTSRSKPTTNSARLSSPG